MWWKFWQRKNGRSGWNRPPLSSREAPPALQPSGWMLFGSGAGEILGLQQLIGNQAVLKLLAVEKKGAR